MLWTILVIAAVVVIGGAVALGTGLLSDSRKQQREYLQAVPGVGPKAPANWFGSHAPEAKLHRRLCDAVTAAHAQPDTPVSGLAALDNAAVMLDQRLIGAAALPAGHREQAIEELAPLVQRFEDSVATFARSAAPDPLGTGFDASMATIQAELDALAQARAEVERIDGQNPPT
ncbi:MAG TPA: hypothetical protein VNQ73_10910 [Ilumatobacter sp.]|nr:hypothetical protein [Ilumatobacter sp.]